jgi:hypothetical protein
MIITTAKPIARRWINSPPLSPCLLHKGGEKQGGDFSHNEAHEGHEDYETIAQGAALTRFMISIQGIKYLITALMEFF